MESKKAQPPSTLQNIVSTILKGGAVGVANIIPGVSGGTMAVVLGIYEKLVTAISQFFTDRLNRKAHFLFLLQIATGALLAILLLAGPIDYALSHHRALTMLFFMGLILGSMPSIFKMQNTREFSLPLMLAVGLGILAVMLLGGNGHQQTAKSTAAALYYPSLCLGAALAGGAMIIPGVSGSFVLLLLGQYQTVIHLVHRFKLALQAADVTALVHASWPLLTIALGVALGVLLFAKLIVLALKYCPAITQAFILGLIAASFLILYQGIPAGGLNMLLAVLLFLGGMVLAFYLAPRDVEEVAGQQDAAPAQDGPGAATTSGGMNPQTE